MTYEFPTNMTDPVDIFKWADKTVDYSFGGGILIVVGIIMFTYLSYKYGATRAFSYTSYVCAILAGFLFMSGLLTIFYFVICMVLAAIGTLILLRES